MANDYVDRVEHLSNILTANQGCLTENTAYYEATHRVKAIGIATPPEMRHLLAAIGWPRMYLDSLEERLDVEGFRLAGKPESDERLWQWWQANRMDVQSGLAHLEALNHGIAYATVAAPDPELRFWDKDTPIFSVESPYSMYAELDHRTGEPKQGIRLYKSPKTPSEDAATLLLPNENVYLVGGAPGGWRVVKVVRHDLGKPLIVPILNRESLRDRMGSSEITRELRSFTDAAARIMMNMQATAELMAVPQRLLFGVAQDEFEADPDNPGAILDAYYARIMAFENEAGRAEQFSAAELRNFTEALDQLAKHVASYTGLPPQYLSFQSDNPASAEAIKSAESRLVKKAERKARLFGSAWEELMRLGMLVMDGDIPSEARRLETIWRDPSTPTYAAKADAVQKLYANGMGLIPKERGRIDMGYSEEERRQMREWDKEEPTAQLAKLMAPPATDKEKPSSSPEV